MYIESLQGSCVVLTLILLSRLENERFTERTESPETLFPTTYVKRSPVSLLEQILNNRRRFGLKRQVGKTFLYSLNSRVHVIYDIQSARGWDIFLPQFFALWTTFFFLSFVIQISRPFKMNYEIQFYSLAGFAFLSNKVI